MSKDILFNEIITVLQDIHNKFEDLRFGQVIQESMDKSKRLNNVNFFDRSSKQILTALNEFNESTNKKRQKGEKI